MQKPETFERLVAAGNPTGEVVGVDRFLIQMSGLDGVAVGAIVMLETGQHGIVRSVTAETVTVLNLDSEEAALGTLAVLEGNVVSASVGNELVGRVITPTGRPIDGKGDIHYEREWPLFNKAPGIMQRSMLSEQLPTGVMAVDSLFPVVLGQRIAVLGDAKSGKTTFLGQLTVNQANTERIVVYVLVGKRRVEIDYLINMLNQTGAINHSIVVVASVFDSLAQSYIAPFVGASIAEFLWYSGRDVVIIYDDLTAHAKVYREISLLSESTPGRESYPGDMFYTHSALLERAGKLATNNKTLTALPVVITPGDDITASLPTSIMSITDGQIIFDLASFRENVRPAVNVGLSVSRVGGRVQNDRQKLVSGGLFKQLAAYRTALEFAHYGSEIADETKHSLQLGKMIYETLRQPPSDLYSLTEQQYMLEVVLQSAGERALNIAALKAAVREQAPAIAGMNDGQQQAAIAALLDKVTINVGTL
jgi:F-type H+-transporting ATPase subunit alpha